MNLKRYLLAAAVALSGTFANAEVIMSRDRDWQVSLGFLQNGTPYCDAKTRAPGFTFSLYFTAGRPATVQLIFDGAQLGDGQMDFSMRVDTLPAWEFTGAEVLANSIFFELPYGRSTDLFLAQLWQGRSLYFLDSRGLPLWSVSLRGSASSLTSLAECRGIIG